MELSLGRIVIAGNFCILFGLFLELEVGCIPWSSRIFLSLVVSSNSAYTNGGYTLGWVAIFRMIKNKPPIQANMEIAEVDHGDFWTLY